MALTKMAINRMNTQGSAQKGKIYLADTGDYYIGLSDGRLSKDLPLRGEVVGTTLRSVVKQFGIYTPEELKELLESITDRLDVVEDDIVELKKLECKLTAYSVVL